MTTMPKSLLLASLLASTAAVGPALAQNDAQQNTTEQQACENLAEINEDNAERFSEEWLAQSREIVNSANPEECAAWVAEAERALEDSDAGTAEMVGGRIVVRQPEPQVTVQQSAPEISVQQGQPVVTIRQPQPEIVVQQARPTVTVDMPEPTITISQPEPNISVNMPEPEVSIQMPEPDISVQQQQPQVRVEQGQPQVDVQVQEPEVVVADDEEQAQVQIENEEPIVREEAGDVQPQVQIEQEQPNVRFESAEPEVQVNQGEPVVRFSQDGDGEAAQSEQQNAAGQPDAPTAPGDADASEPTDGAAAQDGAEMLQLSVETVIDRQVINRNGEELGTVERVVTDGQRNYLVLSHGGFLGLGEDETIVPTDQVTVGPEQVYLVVEAESAEALQQATTVSSDQVQDMTADQTIELSSQ